MPIKSVDDLTLFPGVIKWMTSKNFYLCERRSDGNLWPPTLTMEQALQMAADFPGDIQMVKELQVVLAAARADTASGFVFYNAQNVCRNGLRVFRPTAYQCETMSRVELRIARRDYVQPYETLVIEWPQAFRDRVEQIFPAIYPPIAAVVHWVKDSYLLVTLPLDPFFMHKWIFDKKSRRPDKDQHPGAEVRCVPIGDANASDLESAINNTTPFEIAMPGAAASTDDDRSCSIMMSRTALNLAMLLTEYKFKTIEPVETVEKNRKQQRIAAQRRKYAATYLELEDQHIKLHTVADGVTDDITTETSDFVNIRPHWRRGHRRTLVPGEGKPWKERKVIFVAATMINRHKLGGDSDPNTIIYTP